MVKGDLLGTSVGAMAREVLTREKLEVSVRVLARVLRAVAGGDRRHVQERRRLFGTLSWRYNCC